MSWTKSEYSDLHTPPDTVLTHSSTHPSLATNSTTSSTVIFSYYMSSVIVDIRIASLTLNLSNTWYEILPETYSVGGRSIRVASLGQFSFHQFVGKVRFLFPAKFQGHSFRSYPEITLWIQQNCSIFISWSYTFS